MIIEQNKSLKKLNTFGIDSSAKYFASIKSVDEIYELLSISKFKNEQKLILGGGSNILLTKDFNGLVISIDSKGISKLSEIENEIIISAKAGEVWDDLVDYAVLNNFGGIENLKLIPGKVGAAPIQNIGAYGVELKDTFFELNVVNINTLENIKLSNSDCKFGYRYSIFKEEFKNEFIITEVKLKLQKNPLVNIEYESLKREIEKRNLSEITIADVSSIVKFVRESKLPDPAKIGNAGSFFKNPTVDKNLLGHLKDIFIDIPFYFISENEYKIPAGWLIEKTGLKGIKYGNAGTYEKQALVIVNLGDATGIEIKELSEKIQKEVFNKFKILLTPEVNII